MFPGDDKSFQCPETEISRRQASKPALKRLLPNMAVGPPRPNGSSDFNILLIVVRPARYPSTRIAEVLGETSQRRGAGSSHRHPLLHRGDFGMPSSAAPENQTDLMGKNCQKLNCKGPLSLTLKRPLRLHTGDLGGTDAGNADPSAGPLGIYVVVWIPITLESAYTQSRGVIRDSKL
jgi:hypothetical protein